MSKSAAETDVLVIGAGPGGYVAAIRAGQLGLDVKLADADAFGGTCLNYGCIPSKALLSAAEIAHNAGHRESMGIYADPYVDWNELLEWQSNVVSTLTDGVKHLCRGANVDLVDGHVQFTGENEAVIETTNGEDHELSFEHAILATGSRPITLDAFPVDHDRVLTSRNIFSLSDIPQELLVIGAGYIGLELATLFSKLGTQVTVVELENDVLPGWDDTLRQTIREYIESLNVEFAFGELATTCTPGSNEVRVTTETTGGAETEHTADRVVVAVGRQPVTETVDVDAAGVKVTDRGFVDVDDQCRTSREHIFAVGDIAGEPMLAHKASAEGIVAAETIAGQDASTADHIVPAVVFTDPEVATVGLSEREITEAGYDPVVGQMAFSANGRALTTDKSDGFVRVFVDESSRTILGAQIVGNHASELIGELTLAVHARLTIRQIAETIHAHPTLSEAIMEACADALDEAIHVS